MFILVLIYDPNKASIQSFLLYLVQYIFMSFIHTTVYCNIQNITHTLSLILEALQIHRMHVMYEVHSILECHLHVYKKSIYMNTNLFFLQKLMLVRPFIIETTKTKDFVLGLSDFIITVQVMLN